MKLLQLIKKDMSCVAKAAAFYELKEKENKLKTFYKKITYFEEEL